MKTLIPAVFFQKKLKGNSDSVKVPERLAMFESELDAVVGGRRNGGSYSSDTFSYSAGWLDVEQADDCSA